MAGGEFPPSFPSRGRNSARQTRLRWTCLVSTGFSGMGKVDLDREEVNVDPKRFDLDSIRFGRKVRSKPEKIPTDEKLTADTQRFFFFKSVRSENLLQWFHGGFYEDGKSSILSKEVPPRMKSSRGQKRSTSI